MKNFERWKAAYVAMDDRRRGESLAMAEGAAQDHPALPKRLLLVVANSGVSNYSGDSVCGAHDRFPPVLVRCMGESQ